MFDDGLTHKTAALVMHGLATLRPGAVEVLVVPVGDVSCVLETDFHRVWNKSMAEVPDSDQVAVPVFLRATQGHTTYVTQISRMFVPYDFNSMSVLHGPLLHVSDLNTLKASQAGHLEYSRGNAGLYSTPDFGVARFIPATRDPGEESQDVPHWVMDDFTKSQLPPEALAASTPGQAGGMMVAPTRGSYNKADERHFWTLEDHHNNEWQYMVLFNTRVILKFDLRIAPDGTLVSQQRPKWTDIDKIISLVGLLSGKVCSIDDGASRDVEF